MSDPPPDIPPSHCSTAVAGEDATPLSHNEVEPDSKRAKSNTPRGAIGKEKKPKSTANDPGTRHQPPPFVIIKPKLTGLFECVATTIRTISMKLNKRDLGDDLNVDETITRLFCRSLIYQVESWYSMYFYVRSRAKETPLGLPQDLMALIGYLQPLVRDGHPTVVLDPDYIRQQSESVLAQSGFDGITGQDLVMNATHVRSLLSIALKNDVWTESLPMMQSSLLVHGVVEGLPVTRITGPTNLNRREEIIAAALDLTPYVQKSFVGFPTLYVPKVKNGNVTDTILALTSSQYTASQPVTDEDYPTRVLIPVYRKA